MAALVGVDRSMVSRWEAEQEAVTVSNVSAHNPNTPIDNRGDVSVRSASIANNRERARRRMSEAAKAQKQGVETFPHPDAGKTRDKVAAAVGLGSGRTYDRAVKVSGAGHLPLHRGA